MTPRCVLKTAHFGPCLYAADPYSAPRPAGAYQLPWWYCGKAQERVDPRTDTERRIALQDAKRLVAALIPYDPVAYGMLDRVWDRLYDELNTLRIHSQAYGPATTAHRCIRIIDLRRAASPRFATATSGSASCDGSQGGDLL